MECALDLMDDVDYFSLILEYNEQITFGTYFISYLENDVNSSAFSTVGSIIPHPKRLDNAQKAIHKSIIIVDKDVRK